MKGTKIFDVEDLKLTETFKSKRGTREIVTYYIDRYNKEVTPEKIKDLQEKVNAIEPLADKLKFLDEWNVKYLHNIPAETLLSSGMITLLLKSPGKLFFDRNIQIEKDRVLAEENIRDLENPSPTFADLLTADAKKLLPYLKKNYTDSKPERIGYLLYALKDLQKIDASVLTYNKTALWKALQNSFNKCGSRQQLGNVLKSLSISSSYKEQQIKIVRNALSKVLNKL